MFNIITIVGSLRKESFNKKLMLALDKLNHPNIKFNIFKIDDIPLFNQDHETNLPPVVKDLKDKVISADGILFVTPEYNRSVPGVLKNVIDWGTRPFGKNAWKDKPTGIVGTSPGVIGTAVAQAHLRSIMLALGAEVMGLPEVYINFKEGLIDESGNITDDKTKKFLQEFLDKFGKWIANRAKQE